MYDVDCNVNTSQEWLLIQMTTDIKFIGISLDMNAISFHFS